mmetsp:Transcript_728/g.1329  ORF Transcript_728/g.1329 Transcript_728/m.1329 type:complete len:366 (-) Transcript_728:175-1272(-)
MAALELAGTEVPMISAAPTSRPSKLRTSWPCRLSAPSRLSFLTSASQRNCTGTRLWSCAVSSRPSAEAFCTKVIKASLSTCSAVTCQERFLGQKSPTQAPHTTSKDHSSKDMARPHLRQQGRHQQGARRQPSCSLGFFLGPCFRLPCGTEMLMEIALPSVSTSSFPSRSVPLMLKSMWPRSFDRFAGLFAFGCARSGMCKGGSTATSWKDSVCESSNFIRAPAVYSLSEATTLTIPWIALSWPAWLFALCPLRALWTLTALRSLRTLRHGWPESFRRGNFARSSLGAVGEASSLEAAGVTSSFGAVREFSFGASRELSSLDAFGETPSSRDLREVSSFRALGEHSSWGAFGETSSCGVPSAVSSS